MIRRTLRALALALWSTRWPAAPVYPPPAPEIISVSAGEFTPSAPP